MWNVRVAIVSFKFPNVYNRETTLRAAVFETQAIGYAVYVTACANRQVVWVYLEEQFSCLQEEAHGSPYSRD